MQNIKSSFSTMLTYVHAVLVDCKAAIHEPVKNLWREITHETERNTLYRTISSSYYHTELLISPSTSPLV